MKTLQTLALTIVACFLTSYSVMAQDIVAKTDSLAPIQDSGWSWDVIPRVNDTSLDVGKMVFILTINHVGKVIDVQVLESSVKSKTEKLYQDALYTAKFKKVGPPDDPSKTTTGTITFTLKVN